LANAGLDIVLKMDQLCRSQGNTCSTPEELNEALSFFASIVKEAAGDEGDEAVLTAAPVA
jgi:hypothetical protein